MRDGLHAKKYRRVAHSLFSIAANHNQIMLNGIPVTQQQLIVQTPSGEIAINGKNYFGCMYVYTSAQGIHVNILSSIKTVRVFTNHEFTWNAWGGKKQISEWQSESKKIAQVLEDTLSFASLPPQLLTVRVLLDEWKKNQSKQWHFAAKNGFVIADAGNPNKKRCYKKSDLMITAKHNKLYLDGKRSSASAIRISPITDHITFNNSDYQGSFLIMRKHNKIMCINCLDLEDYVFSVLRTESWPGWPVEVNKAFAIVSRSYVIAMIMEARKANRAYHVKNTNAHQTYQGVHSCRIIKQAVEQTKGVFLGFDRQPVLAMFDSCCGGVIPAHIADFNFDLAPYLAREYACTHCKRCNIYSWQVSYDHDVFERLMAKQAQKLNRLRDVRVTKKDKAGLVNEVTLRGLKNLIRVPGKKLYSMLKEIKSFCFNIRKKSGQIIFTGRGFGHHLGLCQWGAREMVRDGMDYKQILRFYYPGTHFMRVA